ncbi:Type I restriction-modification system, restriction subunit R [Dissulfuribacter thermophilus]|uniref:Type I restriction enzyme endonuclease subunit n=1 Tax=Dissulfuribacter thermophilus TaxID=1156395 RepID=A0A1B9F6Y3_9BACT|nr:type I restriction endonuclease subunit R [Dissulfuribacter thermophilus]OCC15643.1 Type I restriction-modification system, restriction subunit R [Dissulfuribacter thermophilus]
MTVYSYTESTLVQQTTAEYLEKELGWESVYAYNNEDFGPDSLLGRGSDREVVLTRYLRSKLVELNPGLPQSVYDDAIRQITAVTAAQTLLAINREKYALLRDGVRVTFRNDKGDRVRSRLRVFDFDNPENNHFLCVRELWVRGDLYRRRADIVGFVNGLPLLFIECKNIHKNLRIAYEKNLSDYKDTIPHLFHHNAIIMLANGVKARIGSITSKWEHFHEWKRLSEEEPGVVDMETLLKGVCSKRNFMDFFENFIVFDESSGKLHKILARNHQFLGVNRAVEAVRNRKKLQGKLGVFWHTQGAGKSYSMVFFTRKVHRKLGSNFTFLVLTDREDLDTQIYKTFAGCGLVDNDRDPCRASSGKHLKRLLAQQKAYVFSLIQKFNQDVDAGEGYTQRDDIIVLTDEAHRTQYGKLALNMRNALPNASYIGFTGTPLFKDDEITRRVFGDYVSTYDFQRAVEDGATVPLYYDARGDKLGVAIGDLNERVAAKLEEIEISDIDVEQRLERELKRDYHIITAEKRLDQIARDFVQHYSNAWESGKAMLVCIDKIICVRMYNLISNYWKERIAVLETELKSTADEQEEVYLRRQIEWMRETRMAVVISEEQGEVEKFQKWGLDVKPHRRLIKEGMDLPPALREKPKFHNMQRMALDEAFKEEEHPFRVAIVCAMWLTGFDVPSLSILYLDKPLKAHTLMQAIARANRVNEGKNNGLIVDYCGILKYLRKALATFAGQADGGHGGEAGEREPARPEKELLAELKEVISLVRTFFTDHKASLDDIITKTGFERNAAIVAAKEAANESDETRKRFEVMCREVFKKFKACINVKGINAFRKEYDAVNIVYKSLQEDRERADITDIIRELHKVVDEAIETRPDMVAEEQAPYNISKIDFDRLRKEFERRPDRRTIVQGLKQAIEKRLERLLQQNPLRTDFQRHYEEIVAEYNREKDRLTIEKTFEALIKFVQELDKEEIRAIREGLDEESLAIFDLLKKPELSSAEIKRVKKVAVELLQTLKSEKLKIDHWRDKESTRDAVRVTIRDFLWSEETGLPVETYSEEDVESLTEEVFRHIYRAYPTVPSPYYFEAACA